MSADTVDTLHAAEDRIAELEHTIDRMREVLGIPELQPEERWCRPDCTYHAGTWQCGDDCGCPALHDPAGHAGEPEADEQLDLEDEEPDTSVENVKVGAELADPEADLHDLGDPEPPPAEVEAALKGCIECGNTGYLIAQTYGHTSPPQDDDVTIQRCDECQRFAGDIDAAQAYVRAEGPMLVWAIGDGDTMARAADCWVSKTRRPDPQIRPRYVEGVYWIPEDTARALGIYHPAK